MWLQTHTVWRLSCFNLKVTGAFCDDGGRSTFSSDSSHLLNKGTSSMCADVSRTPSGLVSGLHAVCGLWQSPALLCSLSGRVFLSDLESVDLWDVAALSDKYSLEQNVCKEVLMSCGLVNVVPSSDFISKISLSPCVDFHLQAGRLSASSEHDGSTWCSIMIY